MGPVYILGVWRWTGRGGDKAVDFSVVRGSAWHVVDQGEGGRSRRGRESQCDAAPGWAMETGDGDQRSDGGTAVCRCLVLHLHGDEPR